MPGNSVLARAWRVLLLVGLLCAGLPAAPALADTVIGHLGGDISFVGSGGGVIADTSYVVPAGGGRITSFAFQSGPENRGEQLDFLVLRPTGGIDTYVVVGKTGLVTLTGTQTGTRVERFPANITVQGGNILGLWTPGPLHDLAGGTGGPVQFIQLVPDPDVGGRIDLPSGAGTDLNETAKLAPPPSNKFTVSRIKTQTDGTITFTIRVPGPGSADVLETAWNDNLASAAVLLQPAPHRFVFARAHVRAARPGTLSVTVTPNQRGRLLVAHPRYRVVLRLWVSYTPHGGRYRTIGFLGLHLPGSCAQRGPVTAVRSRTVIRCD